MVDLSPFQKQNSVVGINAAGRNGFLQLSHVEPCGWERDGLPDGAKRAFRALDHILVHLETTSTSIINRNLEDTIARTEITRKGTKGTRWDGSSIDTKDRRNRARRVKEKTRSFNKVGTTKISRTNFFISDAAPVGFINNKTKTIYLTQDIRPCSHI